MKPKLGAEIESEKQKIPLTIRVPRKTYNRIKEISEANDLSLAEVGRRLIHSCLKELGFQEEKMEVEE